MVISYYSPIDMLILLLKFPMIFIIIQLIFHYVDIPINIPIVQQW